MLIPQIQKFSVVVEFDAIDDLEDTDSGTFHYEIEAMNASTASIEALKQANHHLQTVWRKSARLYNSRVTAILLTNETREAIQAQMESGGTPTEG